MVLAVFWSKAAHLYKSVSLKVHRCVNSVASNHAVQTSLSAIDCLHRFLTFKYSRNRSNLALISVNLSQTGFNGGETFSAPSLARMSWKISKHSSNNPTKIA